MGWLATVIMLYGSFLVGERNRTGFLCQIAGNLLWAVVGVTRGFQLDLVVVSIAFCLLYVRNYVKWLREDHATHQRRTEDGLGRNVLDRVGCEARHVRRPVPAEVEAKEKTER